MFDWQEKMKGQASRGKNEPQEGDLSGGGDQGSQTIRVPDCGIVYFEISGRVFPVDLFLFHNERVLIDQEEKDGTGKELVHYIDLVKKYSGITEVSGQQAWLVIHKVDEIIATQKKMLEMFVFSHGATDSTAGGSPESSSN